MILFRRAIEVEYGKGWEQDCFVKLTRIKHLGNVEDYNSKFQVLSTRVNSISDQHLLESYMGGLKEYIKHDIFLKQSEKCYEIYPIFSPHSNKK